MASVAWVIAALAGQPQTHLDASIEIRQRIGELPQGSTAGGSDLTYDATLAPRIGLRILTPRDEIELSYGPRMLLRYRRDLEGQFSALETDGRPVLVRHSFKGQTRHRLEPRFTLTNTLGFEFGELDFATFAAQGLVQDGDPGTVALGDSVQVFESTTLRATSQLRGPLVGRYDWFTQARMSVTLPDPSSPTVGGDDLCFSDPSGASQQEPTGLLSDSCLYEFSLGTVFPVGARDELSVSAGYRGNDIDPGGLFHAVFVSAELSHKFSRSWEGQFLQGLLVLVEDGQGDGISLLPLTRFSLLGRLVNKRRFVLLWETSLDADGRADGINQQFLLRTGASTSLTAQFHRDFRLAVSANGFLIGPELGCPPRLAAPDVRTSGCPRDLTAEERAQEVEALSGLYVRALFEWNFAPRASMGVTGAYGFRAPHVTRWGTNNDGTTNRELVAGAVLRVGFSTQANSRQ